MKRKLFTYTRGNVPLYRIFWAFKGVSENGTQANGTKMDYIVYANQPHKLYWSWDEAQIKNLGKKIWEITKTPEGWQKHQQKINASASKL